MYIAIYDEDAERLEDVHIVPLDQVEGIEVRRGQGWRLILRVGFFYKDNGDRSSKQASLNGCNDSVQPQSALIFWDLWEINDRLVWQLIIFVQQPDAPLLNHDWNSHLNGSSLSGRSSPSCTSCVSPSRDYNGSMDDETGQFKTIQQCHHRVSQGTCDSLSGVSSITTGWLGLELEMYESQFHG